MTVTFEGKSATFPESVNDMLLETKPALEFTSEKFGKLKLDSYVMKPQASADLDGSHQLHLVSSAEQYRQKS